MTAPYTAPPKPPAANASWQGLIGSPFVQDTLMRVLGGAPPGYVQGPEEYTHAYPSHTGAVTARDTINFYEPKASLPILTHEVGHVFDDRNVAPDIVQRVLGHPLPKDPYAETYAAAGMGQDSTGAAKEHAADAFSRAMLSGRRGFSDSTKAERDVPGAIEMVRWLRTRPPFAPQQADSAGQCAGRVRGHK